MVLWATSFGTILKLILIAYGHVKDRETPLSFPLAIQDMPYVVLCNGLEPPAKLEEKLSHARHCQPQGQKTPVSVLASFYQCQLGCWWCLQGFCMSFRQLAYLFWNRTPYCCFHNCPNTL